MTSTNTRPMKAAAMAYAQKGIAIFPLTPGKKTPVIKKEDGGNGCLDATTDTATIKAWWSKYPNANIGYATGKINDIVVIDVDTGHHNEEDGADTIRSLEKKLGPLPDTKMQLTPNGGTHFFFKYPDSFDIKNYESKRADDPKVDRYEGIDIVGIDIRGNGGYVVAQPSTIKKKDGTMGKYIWEVTADVTDFAELPIAWQEFIYDLEYTSPNSTASNGEPTPTPVWNGEGFDILTEVMPLIDCTKRNYSEWVSVGMALKNLGYPCDEWDKWSRTDPSRYVNGECEHKWETFQTGEGNRGARYLIGLAKAGGLKTQPPAPDAPYYIEKAEQRDRAPLAWDGIISDRGDIDPQPPKPSNAQPEKENTQGRGAALPEIHADNYEPDDYTDVGQATVYASVFDGMVKYTPATSFLVYDGAVWNESEIKAQGLTQQLTELQLHEARARVRSAQDKLNKAVESGDNAKIQAAKEKLAYEESYRKYVLGQRKSNKIKATMTEARPKIEIDVKALDADGYLLNTPNGTVDLHTGELLPHNPLDYCTKITAVGPNTDNAAMFNDFIDRVTVGDKDLARYLQEVAGMCAVGQVLRENLIIAYGHGGNGKSTLFNLLAHVMGDYAGNLSAETLTANCRKNKSPEYAELRGKRIVIAAELEEGMRLDTSVVKKLCSTDDVYAEKKYKDPFSYHPSHTVILYTNHLPRVGTNDKGTWDRLICVPFNASFRGTKGEILNYSEHLFNECGGAVLTWIIEGAQRFIANQYKIDLPQCVIDALAEYRAANDWLQSFLNDCCDVEKAHREKSGELYRRYREYCEDNGEYTRSAPDFKSAMMGAGFKYHGSNKGVIVYGLRVKEPELAEVYHTYGSGSGYYSRRD